MSIMQPVTVTPAFAAGTILRFATPAHMSANLGTTPLMIATERRRGRPRKLRASPELKELDFSKPRESMNGMSTSLTPSVRKASTKPVLRRKRSVQSTSDGCDVSVNVVRKFTDHSSSGDSFNVESVVDSNLSPEVPESPTPSMSSSNFDSPETQQPQAFASEIFNEAEAAALLDTSRAEDVAEIVDDVKSLDFHGAENAATPSRKSIDSDMHSSLFEKEVDSSSQPETTHSSPSSPTSDIAEDDPSLSVPRTRSVQLEGRKRASVSEENESASTSTSTDTGKRVKSTVESTDDATYQEDDVTAEDYGVLDDAQNIRGAISDNTLRWYLKMIGMEGLLRANEEVELGRAIRDLMTWERARRELAKTMGRQPSVEEWAHYLDMDDKEFAPLLSDARRAKDRMIVSNLRLVVSIAKKYMHRGLPLSDMIQEGTLGLIRAAEKFDIEKGFKFSTYATWWVKQAVARSIADQSRSVRLPVHVYESITCVRKATKYLSDSLGRPPTEEELAQHVGMTLEKLRATRMRMQHSVALDSPLSAKDDSLSLQDVIESPIESPEETVDNSLLREDLEHVINSLTPRERDVVRMRYGLDDGRIKTLEEIGRIFSVTKERVRQIENKALRKLRHPFRSAVLRDYSADGIKRNKAASRLWS